MHIKKETTTNFGQDVENLRRKKNVCKRRDRHQTGGQAGDTSQVGTWIPWFLNSMIKWTTERPAPVGLFQNVHIFLCLFFFSFPLNWKCVIFFVFLHCHKTNSRAVLIIYTSGFRSFLTLLSCFCWSYSRFPREGDRLRECPVLMPLGPLPLPRPQICTDSLA